MEACLPNVLDLDASDWSGHLLPFGTDGRISRKAETIEGTLKPATFINRYVIKSRPVIVTGLLTGSPGVQTWDDTYLGNAPPSAMTNISVYDSSAAKLTRTTMSMRDFVRSHNHDLFIFDQVPAYLMKDLVFPRIFKCSSFLKNLSKQILAYYKGKIITEPVLASHDRLICPVRGKSTHTLVPASQWENLAANETTIDYSSVSYETHPWLRSLTYQTARDMNPGDCLYVPSTWYVQSSYADVPHSSVVLSWKPQIEKVNKALCGDQDLKSAHHIGAYSHYFSQAEKERDVNKDALIHYFVFYLGDNLHSSFKVKQFIRKLKRDKKLFAKLEKWTEEINEISTELFELLDVNGDSVFSLNDIAAIPNEENYKQTSTFQARDELVSQIQDRLQDFAMIMDEQQAEKKQHQAQAANKKKQRSEPVKSASGGAAGASGGSTGGDNLADDFKAEMQKEIDKMLEDLKREEAEMEAESAAEQKKSTKKRAAHKDKNKDDPKTREEIKREAKIRAAKKKIQANDGGTPPVSGAEKYKSVSEDEEIEIIAEEDEPSGVKGNTKNAGKSNENSSSATKERGKVDKSGSDNLTKSDPTRKPSAKEEL